MLRSKRLLFDCLALIGACIGSSRRSGGRVVSSVVVGSASVESSEGADGEAFRVAPRLMHLLTCCCSPDLRTPTSADGRGRLSGMLKWNNGNGVILTEVIFYAMKIRLR